MPAVPVAGSCEEVTEELWFYPTAREESSAFSGFSEFSCGAERGAGGVCELSPYRNITSPSVVRRRR
jgi:hypothetical protein